MPEQPDLLIIRLDELQADIAEVQCVLEKAATRHNRLAALSSAAERLGAELSVARLNASHLTLLAEEKEDIQRRLEERNVSYTDLESSLRRALAETKEIGNWLAKVGQAMIHLDELSPEEMLTRCEEISTKIDEIRDTAGTSELSRSDAWARFDSLADTQCRALFADYVDLLGGLTLRDTELDDRSSELTDELLHELGVRVLAVPARPAEPRGPAAGSSLDSMVKLWFPEWTMWAVPLFGFDAGLAWSHTNSPLARQLLGSPDPPYRRRCLVADAYATYALGPAYACAAVLLRLRPLVETAEPAGPAAPPTDVERAYVILTLLGEMGDTGTFAAVTDAVAACWAEATRQRGCATETAGRADLDDFAAKAHRALAKISSFKPFDAERWETEARSLYDALSGGGTDAVYGETSVRGLLNAAWAAHLDTLDDPAKLAEIGENAMKLWRPQRQLAPSSPKPATSSLQPQGMPSHGAPLQFPRRDGR